MTVPDTAGIYKSIIDAHKRISPYVRRTPLNHSVFLSKLTDCEVHLKMESEQVTGSFKVRGAFNEMLVHSRKSGKSGLHFIAASTGNHGIGTAYAASILKERSTIYVPVTVSMAKLKSLQLYNVEVKRIGSTYFEASQHAKKEATRLGAHFVSPYTNLDVIGGQGTVGKEIVEELPEVDAIFVAVGGGGAIAGIAAYAKHQKRPIEIVGCQPKNSPTMTESIRAGKVVQFEAKETLSDGTPARCIGPDTITFPLCQKLVDRWMLVSEEEIADAMYLLLEEHRRVVEGSSGVVLAAFLRCHKEYVGKKVALVMCGGNVSMEKLKFVVSSVEARRNKNKEDKQSIRNIRISEAC